MEKVVLNCTSLETVSNEDGMSDRKAPTKHLLTLAPSRRKLNPFKKGSLIGQYLKSAQ